MDVTWEGIFQFCLVIIAVITLVRQDNKKRQPPNFSQSNGYLLAESLGSRPTGSTLCIYTIPQSGPFVNCSVLWRGSF